MGNNPELALRYSEKYIKECCCRGTGWVAIDVPVGDPLFGEAIPCICQRDRNKRSRYYDILSKSGLTQNEIDRYNFQKFVPTSCRVPRGYDREEVIGEMVAIKKYCEFYANKPDGWLVLCGDYGSGKTSLALAIAIENMSLGRYVFASTTAAMLELLREGYSSNNYHNWTNQIINMDLIVIDDLGAQRHTDWASEVLFEIINYRYTKGWPMVVTTNEDLLSEQCAIEPRIRSRLLDGSEVQNGFSKVIMLPCGDFRPTRGN